MGDPLDALTKPTGAEMIRAIWRILRRPQPPRRQIPPSDDLLCETYLEKLARMRRDMNGE